MQIRSASRATAMGAIGVLALVAVLLVAAVLTHPWWLASVVAKRLTETSGRPAAIGRIVVTWTPGGGLQVAMHDLDIANAAWADPAWPLIKARAMVARVAVGTTLAQRRPVIRELILRDARVDLERQADGLRNWRLRDPHDRRPGRFKVQALTAENSDVRFVHGGIALVLEARARPASAAAAPATVPGAGSASASAPLPTQIAITARWRGIAASGDFTTGPTLTFLETAEPVPIRGRIVLPGVVADVDGRAADLFRAPLVDMRLALRAAAVEPVREAVRRARSSAGFDWAAMREPLVLPAAPSAARPRVLLDAQLHVEPRRVALDSLRAHLGPSDIEGRIAWEHEDRGRVEVDARSDRVVLEDLRDLARGWGGGDPDHVEGSSPGSKPDEATGRRWPDADIRYAAQRAHWNSGGTTHEAGPVRVEASVRQRRVELKTLEFGLGGGRVSGSGALDGSATPPGGEATLTLRGLDLATLMPHADAKHRATGRIDGSARLSARGSAWPEWLASLGGRADLALRDGTLPALVDAELGLQTLRIARHVLGAPRAVPLPCAALALEVNDGEVHVRRLVLDSDRTLTRGRGRIDLKARTLDLTLSGEAKGRALFVLDRSIRLHGQIARPQHDLVPRVDIPAAGCRSDS